jgi:iron complex outermembrane receptor protein
MFLMTYRNPRQVVTGVGLSCVLLLTAEQPAMAQAAGTVQIPTVTVTAQKEPAEAQKLPVSVTTVQEDTIDRAGINVVSDAAIFAPNTFFSELTARKISNATFRGIGSSPANAGVTTVIDGVPQLNTNSSSLLFRDVEQVEFVRGPQSALFGRNTLGGVINITSRRPSLLGWNGRVLVPFANSAGRTAEGGVAGPLNDGTLGFGAAFAYGTRDGFTTNTVTGNRVDNREAFSGKAQLLWLPAPAWETRLIVSGERDRDGDYTLADLDAARRSPFQVARDFEGYTHRDVLATTVLARRQGARLTFSSATGVVRWRTEDATDLDYSPLPLLTRDNLERDLQFTQEVRVASSADAPLHWSDALALQWQAGVFFFTQHYTQDAINHFGPGVLSEFLPVPVDQHSPQAALDDRGVGLFGQATLVLGSRVDVGLAARLDHESKEADLSTFYTPAIAPAQVVDAERDFTSVSPQVSVAFRPSADRTLYASMAQGFKAGGFNPASPPGSEPYGEEHAWHLEGGWKSLWAGGRLQANAAAFYIDWDDLQLNVPNPGVPGQFYIANVGAATSRGLELELLARPRRDLSLFGAFGYTRARFGAGSSSSGADVTGNDLPNTPQHTTMLGGEYTRPVGTSFAFARVESVFYGSFAYDPSNAVRQDAYSLLNLRGGLRGGRIIVEGWIRNALDARYVPIAFPYPGLAPSGYVGELGLPRTFGATVGVAF